MGRWAQRRLGNGGGGSGPAPILITSVTEGDYAAGDTVVNFSAEVDAADFNTADFEVLPSTVAANGVGQNTPTQLSVSFGFDISGETDLSYAGTAPNVSTPQTVPLTF